MPVEWRCERRMSVLRGCRSANRRPPPACKPPSSRCTLSYTRSLSLDSARFRVRAGRLLPLLQRSLPVVTVRTPGGCINGGVTRVVAVKGGRGASRVAGACRRYERACPESTGTRSRSPWHNRLSRWSPTILVRYGLERKRRSRHSFASSSALLSPLSFSFFLSFYLSICPPFSHVTFSSVCNFLAIFDRSVARFSHRLRVYS